MPRRNLVPNPSFERTNSLWGGNNLNYALRRVALSVPGVNSGTYVVDTRAANAGGLVITMAQPLPATPAGTTVTTSIFVYQGSGTTKNVRLDNDFYTAASKTGHVSTDSTTGAVANNTWTRIANASVVPAGAGYTSIWVEFEGLPDDAYVAVDGAMMDFASIYTDYADGDSPGWEWDGNPHASSSRESYVPATGERVNWCPNPSADVHTIGYSVAAWQNGAASSNLTRDANRGTGGAFIVPNLRDADGGNNGQIFIWYPEITVTAGQAYTFSAHHAELGASRAQAVDWLRSDGSTISYLEGAVVNDVGTDEFTFRRASVIGTAPAGAVRARPVTRVFNIKNGAQTLVFDRVMYEKTGTLGSYFDGDSTNATWLGAPGESASVLLSNTPPVANAGPDQTVYRNQVVQLDGTASSDVQGPVTYSWSVLYNGGSGVTNSGLTGRTSATPTFTAPNQNAGIGLRLTVTDSNGVTSTDDVVVTVIERPVVNAAVAFAATGTFTADGVIAGLEQIVRRNLSPDPTCKYVVGSGAFGGARVTGLTGFDRTTGYEITASDGGPARCTVPTNTGVYTYSAYVRANYTGTFNATVNFYQSGQWDSDTAAESFAVESGVVRRIALTRTPSPDADEALIYITSNDGSLIVTQVLAEAGTELLPYFDGDSPDAVWDGGDGASTSTLTTLVRPPDDAQQAALTVSASTSFTVAAPLVVPRWSVTFGENTAELAAAGRVIASPTITYRAEPRTAARASVVLRTGTTVAVDVAWSARAVVVWTFPRVTYPVGTAVVSDLFVAPPPPGRTIITRRQLYVPAQRRGVRFIVQDILTGEFLSWDLPVSEPTITYTLSGSKTISGFIDPEYRDVADLGMKSMGTWIHVEEDGQIRGSGILQPGSLEGSKLTIDCAGFSSYAHRVPYRSVFQGIQVDPLDVARHIWSHVQSYPTGDLNVTLDATASPVRIGTEPRDVEFETGEGETVAFEAGPYKLNWWTATNCGKEFDDLAKETPFDYVERDTWNADKTDVEHHLVLGYPRVGRKRDSLKFAQDENIEELVAIEEDPDLGVSEVIYTGAGEGSSMIQGAYVGQPDGRLRVPIVVEDSSITRTDRARAFAEDEYLRRRATVGVKSIVINARHENAKLGTFAEGDDILVQSDVAYVGRIALWHRIVGYDHDPDAGRAALELRRSDTFRYGRPGE